jgi:hypothetical protein
MTMNRHWALPLALVGGVAIGRSERVQGRKRQHKQDLQAWEDEGGSLPTPAAAQPRS